MTPIRVLLVESDPDFRQLLARFLRQQSDDIIVQVSDGAEAVARAERLRPHVVVVDLGTPGLDGLASISMLHSRMPEVGVVAMSLVSDAGYRKVALAAGAHDFVPKIALFTDLLAAIKRVAREDRILQAAVVGGEPPVYRRCV